MSAPQDMPVGEPLAADRAAPGEGAVLLRDFEVRALRRYLARAQDYETTTAQERADARIELCGYLAGALGLDGARDGGPR